MAPTVYIADISCDADTSDISDTDQADTPPTYILDFGGNDLRVRRRNHMMGQRDSFRIRRPLLGIAADQSRHPTHADQARVPRHSIDTADTASRRYFRQLDKISENRVKAWLPRSSHFHRLLLLRRKEGLLDITVRTVALIRRNQQLQVRLAALQAETRAFVQSVMSNPENKIDNVKKEDISDSEGSVNV